jgi:acyl-CoA hydrolase
MVLDMLTAAELDQLHAKLVSGSIRLADQLIEGCQHDMHRVSGWFTGSPEHLVLKAALAEQAELAAEVYAELKIRWAAALAAAANPYEQACERFNIASANYPKAKAEAERILREASDEYDAAAANLRRYESQPGIPLPEYR